MVSPRTIRVEIDEKGNAVIETSGFTGSDCLKETIELEQALGVVSKRTNKAEMYKTTTVGNKAKVGGS